MIKKIIFSIELICDIICNFFTKRKVVLISEGMDWVINEECKNVMNFLNIHTDIKARISLTPTGAKNKILHFFSANTFLDKNGVINKGFFHNIHPSNKIILTWFHISENDSFRLKYIPQLNKMVDLVHTASSTTKNKLINNGLDENKIVIIPLGVDTKKFKPVSIEEKKLLRKAMDLPENKIIIGSFQKDGNGWKDGLEPKLIKGPDIFCDVVEKLSEKYPIHVLLTGPARGYVKKRLDNANIPYTHKYLKKYQDIVPYYQVLDLYLICSREEGGPKALLESMATGIPLVSTKVGMVSDVIDDGINGFLANIEDVATIAKQASLILENDKIRKEIIENSTEKVSGFDLSKTEQLFYDIYNKI